MKKLFIKILILELVVYMISFFVLISDKIVFNYTVFELLLFC